MFLWARSLDHPAVHFRNPYGKYFPSAKAVFRIFQPVVSAILLLYEHSEQMGISGLCFSLFSAF